MSTHRLENLHFPCFFIIYVAFVVIWVSVLAALRARWGFEVLVRRGSIFLFFFLWSSVVFVVSGEPPVNCDGDVTSSLTGTYRLKRCLNVSSLATVSLACCFTKQATTIVNVDFFMRGQAGPCVKSSDLVRLYVLSSSSSSAFPVSGAITAACSKTSITIVKTFPLPCSWTPWRVQGPHSSICRRLNVPDFSSFSSRVSEIKQDMSSWVGL